MESASSKRCIVNIGLYKTGTTTLAKAAHYLRMKVCFEFPPELDSQTLKNMLLQPSKAIDDYIVNNFESFMNHFIEYDYVTDGWFSLLPLASLHVFKNVTDEARKRRINLTFVCTQRELMPYLKSELHHWVRYGIENEAGLSTNERSVLQDSLRSRYFLHKEGIERLSNVEDITCLGLHHQDTWARKLSSICPGYVWEEGIHNAGIQNCAPELPTEAILLTMRVVDKLDECVSNIESLLDDIEKDPLCSYMLVLAFDDDEYESTEATKLKTLLESRPRLKRLHVLKNPKRCKGEVPKICQIWASMAEYAWKKGASWVIFLGDDVRIHCPFHYRVIYRYFMDNQIKFNLGRGKYFGCPWFNDVGFDGFPTFPIVGKEHFDIFGALIPAKDKDVFINQDLDPYLQRLYLKFGAAPVLHDLKLTNACGGSDTVPARYKRIPALNWRERVLENECIAPILSYLQGYYASAQHWDSAIGDEIDLVQQHSLLLVDVVIPSYRIELEYLQRICSIEVPPNMRTSFIVIIDNPLGLVKLFDLSENTTPSQAAFLLEKHLVKMCLVSGVKNDIRVRCNDVNMGASASRNRGIHESAAEYIVFLDDDVIPNKNLLQKYGEALENNNESEPILGLVGLVRFPRDPNMTALHAGVFLSYLLFSFEIAANNMYSDPAWGVTANILYKKFPGMSFDTRYAKTGGGEDVDFALRLSQDNGNLKLKCCPSACVTHLFWSDNMYVLCKHFFNWAIGDSALFYRFEALSYLSYPNFVETWCFLSLPLSLSVKNYTPLDLFNITLLMFTCDAAVEMSWNWGIDFKHRRSLLEQHVSFPFAFLAHILANFYVIVLEFGRLYGHLRRGHVLNISRRFDWHCGRLEHSRRNFIQREKIKFFAFIAVNLVMISSLSE